MTENPDRGSGDWTFWRSPWWQAAHAMGARFLDFTSRTSPEGPAAIQLHTEHGTISLLRHWFGRDSTTTELRAPFCNPCGIAFDLIPTIPSGLTRKIHGVIEAPPDVSVGDRFLDRRFEIRTESPAEVGAVLSDARIRKILVSLPRFPISVGRTAAGEASLGGVHQIRCTFAEVPVNPRRIQQTFELVGEMLRWFAEQGANYGDPVGRHIERLHGPGGSVSAKLGNGIELPLWDGDVERVRAVQALGLLGDARAIPPLIQALNDFSEAVRLVAARALGGLPDARAIAALIPLLGDRSGQAPGLGRVAAEALDQLGVGPLVRAFDEALQGDAGRLSALTGAYRPQVIDAFARTLTRPDRRTFANAYTALAALRAVEVLPYLRAKSTEVRMEGIRQECLSAIAALEELQTLPRAADPNEACFPTLPRSVGTGARDDVAGLPRQSSGPA